MSVLSSLELMDLDDSGYSAVADVREGGFPHCCRIRCFPEYGKSPLFGVNAAADVPGAIRVGDPVFAIRKP